PKSGHLRALPVRCVSRMQRLARSRPAQTLPDHRCSKEVVALSEPSSYYSRECPDAACERDAHWHHRRWHWFWRRAAYGFRAPAIVPLASPRRALAAVPSASTRPTPTHCSEVRRRILSTPFGEMSARLAAWY